MADGPTYDDDCLFDRKQVDEKWGIPRGFLEKAAVEGGGPPMIKIGRRVRYRYADLKIWIAAHKVASTSELPR